MSDLSAIAADATKAVEALPTVINAVSQIQGDLTNSQHASIVTAAADALTVAAQSAQSLGAQGVIGHNDAGNLASGVALASDSLSIVAEINALATKLKALVKHIL